MDMMNYVIKKSNITASGVQTLNFKTSIISVEKVLSCTQEDWVRYYCEKGCVNYGKKWSCPPYSNKFSTIVASKGYDTLIVIVGYIDLSDMKYIRNPYQQVKAANMILKSKCEKIALNIERKFGGYSLLSGSCNLCKPCQKKRDLPCRKPEMVRYSLESTGINVEKLLEKFCGHKLLWYKRGEELLYTSVVTAILIDSEVISNKNAELYIKQYINEAKI